MSMSGFAGGASQALERLLAEEFLKTIQRKKLAQDDRSLDLQQGRDTVAAELGRGNLGVSQRNAAVNEGNLGMRGQEFQEGVRRFDIEQPIRGQLQIAQTAQLNRQPEEAQKARDFTSGRDKVLHGYRIGEIGASGAQDRQTLGARQAAAPVPQAQADYAGERTSRIRDAVANLKNRVSGWTTGAGSMLANVPATDARDFAADLNQLKSNIAFGELAEMRAASRTGGALGAVSERELTLLESALGALDQGQSPENFAKNLDAVLASLDRWEAAKAGSKPMPAHSTGGGALDVDALIKKYSGGR